MSRCNTLQQSDQTTGSTASQTSYEELVMEEVNKARMRLADEVGTFCSLIDVSCKTYHTWQSQFAKPDFITYMHILNCTFDDSVRDAIRPLILEALDSL
jgi:DNA-binding transcriptional regulator YiaG